MNAHSTWIAHIVFLLSGLLYKRDDINKGCEDVDKPPLGCDESPQVIVGNDLAFPLIKILLTRVDLGCPLDAEVTHIFLCPGCSSDIIHTSIDNLLV
jgi:hypothetical protein